MYTLIPCILYFCMCDNYLCGSDNKKKRKTQTKSAAIESRCRATPGSVRVPLRNPITGLRLFFIIIIMALMKCMLPHQMWLLQPFDYSQLTDLLWSWKQARCVNLIPPNQITGLITLYYLHDDSDHLKTPEIRLGFYGDKQHIERLI